MGCGRDEIAVGGAVGPQPFVDSASTFTTHGSTRGADRPLHQGDRPHGSRIRPKCSAWPCAEPLPDVAQAVGDPPKHRLKCAPSLRGPQASEASAPGLNFGPAEYDQDWWRWLGCLSCPVLAGSPHRLARNLQ